MTQFSSILDTLDLPAATDYCREKGELYRYLKGISDNTQHLLRMFPIVIPNFAI